MAYRWLLKSQNLLIASLALLVIIAVACGGSATATSSPQATTGPAAVATMAPPVVGAMATPIPLGPGAIVAPTPTPVTAAPAAKVTGQRGGILRMQAFAFPAQQYVPHVDWQVTVMADGFYNTLVQYDPTTFDSFDITGDLAKSWELSSDGLTYTFRLHENAKWHDGTPLTADDVVYSIERMVDPDARRPNSRQTVGAYYESGTVKAIDKYTVDLSTKFPTEDILAVLSIAGNNIVPQHYLPGLEEEYGTIPPWGKAMGSGPYTPGRIVRDVSWEWDRNDDYFKEGLPLLDGVKQFVIIEKGTIIAAFKTEQVLMSGYPITNLNTRDALQLDKESPNITTHFTPPNNLFQFGINRRKEPFNDKRVTQALSLALDRYTMRDIMGIPGLDVVAPAVGGLQSAQWWGRTEEEILQLPGYRRLPDGSKHPDDIAAAKQLLADAGFPDGFTVKANATPLRTDIAVLIADQLKQTLNITIELSIIDQATSTLLNEAQDFTFSFGSDPPAYVSPDAWLSKDYMPWSNAVFQNAWDVPEWFEAAYWEQAQELDREKRKVIIRKIEDYLINVDPGPYIIPFWEARHVIVNDRIRNFNMTPFSASHLKQEHLWCDPC
jgi:peptide/nickel transport system substrate-binding protein